MKILMVVHSLRRGGAERVLLEVALGLFEKGHDVNVLAWLDVDEYPDECYRKVPRHYILHSNEYRWPWAVPRAAKGLREFVKTFYPDVIEIHSQTVSWVVACANLNIPCVHVIHGYGAITHKRFGRDNLVRVVDRMVQSRLKGNFISVSPSMAEVAAPHFGTVTTSFDCVPNGVDLNKYRLSRNPSDRSPPTILMLGTLSPHKGQSFGIRAVKLMLEFNPNVRLWIVGEGADREALESLVKELSLEEHVEFLGRRADVPEIMLASDVLWQLSTSEGLPVVVLEAMASGLPVVGFDVRGIRDVVNHGETGYLVPHGDIQAIAYATTQILHDELFHQRISEKARVRVQQDFSLRSMVDGHERVLLNAAEQKKLSKAMYTNSP